MDPTGERLVLPPAVPGLGGGYRGRRQRPGDHITQPANPPVPVHLHYLGVLPHADQAVHHVPFNAAYTG